VANKAPAYLNGNNSLKQINFHRVIESFMDGTVKEQWLRTKKINAQKGRAKTY
jgi:hypothetical protein